ncbi:MAG: hypothetical protein AAB420_00025 [Patescibacteria group bacterium]
MRIRIVESDETLPLDYMALLVIGIAIILLFLCLALSLGMDTKQLKERWFGWIGSKKSSAPLPW